MYHHNDNAAWAGIIIAIIYHTVIAVSPVAVAVVGGPSMRIQPFHLFFFAVPSYIALACAAIFTIAGRPAR